MTAPNVTTTLTIRGRDEASAELRKVSDSAGGLSDRLRDATASGSGLSDSLRSIASGDITGGLSGLADALGVSGVTAAALSAAAGIGATAAAIGAAAVKTTEWSMQIELLRARMDTAFVGGSAEAFAIADAVGVSVGAVVELQTSLRASGAEGEITVAQLRAMTDAAMALGKDGDEALTAFASALRTGATDGLAQVGVMVRGKSAIAEYAKTLGKSTAEMSVAERAQAVLMATQEAANRAVGAGSAVLGRQDDALDALGNRWEELKQVLSALVAGPAARMVESLVAIASKVRDAIPVVLALGRVAIAPVVQIFNALSAAVEANAAALRGDFAGAAKLAGKALSSALAPEDAIGNIRRVMEEVDAFGAASRRAAQYTAASGTAAQATSGQIGGLAVAFGMIAQAVDQVAKAQAKFAPTKPTSPAARRRAAPTPAEPDGDEFMEGLARDLEATSARLTELQAAEFAAVQEAARQYDHLRDRVLGAYTEIATDPARKAALEIQQIEIAAAREMAQVQEMMHLSSAQQAELSAAIQVQALERVRAKQVELQAAEFAVVQEAARQYDHLRDRVLGAYTEIATDPARKAALEIQQIEIAAAREMAQVQEMMHLSSAQQAELSAAIQVQALERVRAKQVEVRQAVASQVQAWAGAGLAIARALGVGDAAARVSAALQAIIAGADAFKYAASGNIPGAIASGAAAIGYAKAALTPAPATPGGAVAPAVRAAPTPAASGGGGQSHTTIHLHGIMTTRAEVGVGVATAMKAAKATGYLPQGVPA